MTRRATKTPVRKRVPAGARGTSIADQANRAGGKADQIFGDVAAPASGPRPNPGPLPVLDPDAGAADLRHAPLRFQFPYAVNQVWTPRRSALTPFAILRQLADVSPEIRTCIETRKDQMCSIGWDIGIRGQQGARKSTAKVERARAFFRKPDQRRSFSDWLRMAIEEVLVIDALSIYRRRTFGGDLYALEIKDGTLFLPLLADDGDTPMPPAVAYRQIVNGVPMAGGDCTVEDLIYRPRTVRSHTPYGMSPTESVLLAVNAALQRSVFNLQYYTEGTVPEGLLEAPTGWTTQQLTEFQEYLDDFLTGNLAARRRLKVVAQGSKLTQFKEPAFETQYDEWLMMVICAAFAVPPQEIGFTNHVNKATGEMQENVVYRRGVKPLSGYFKDTFDMVLADDLDSPELEWVWTGGEVEDVLAKAQADKINVQIGKVSVDELRVRDGQEAIGMTAYVMTTLGPVFVDDLLNPKPDPVDPNAPTPKPGDKPAAGGKKTAEPNLEAEPHDVSEAALADLRKWRGVAIKAVKAGKPQRAFESDAIPMVLQTAIEHELRRATQPLDVVKAFDTGLAVHEAVRKDAEIRKLSKRELKAAKSVKRLMVDHFQRQGDALVAHLKDKLS